MGKPRVNLRLSHKLHAELERRTAASSVTKTEIVEEALSRFFDPEANLVLEQRLLRRMDAFDERQSEIERDTALCLETLAHFVFYWLTRTEPIPEGERDAAHALGQRRFDHFIGFWPRPILVWSHPLRMNELCRKIRAWHGLSCTRKSL